MSALDVFSRVHLGRLRTGPPATGVEPQRDGLLRGHIGRLVIYDGTELTDDDVFCVTLADDDDFEVALVDDEVFCAVLEDDDDFGVTLEDDDAFCVILVDEDEVEL